MLQISIKPTTQQLVATWDKRINQCTTTKTVSECSLNEETLKPRHFDPIQKRQTSTIQYYSVGFGTHVVTSSRRADAPLLPFESHDQPLAFFGLGWGGADLWVWVSFWGPRQVWSPMAAPRGGLLRLVAPSSTLFSSQKKKRLHNIILYSGQSYQHHFSPEF